VLDQLRDVAIWLARDPAPDGSGDWRPDRLLTGLFEADGGYLKPVQALAADPPERNV
jgi:hypothetical protein